jgi:hypothetical protein
MSKENVAEKENGVAIDDESAEEEERANRDEEEAEAG